MAGTMTIQGAATLLDLGSVAPISKQWTITDIDEVITQVVDVLAISTSYTLILDRVASIQGLLIHVSSAGSSGLAVDLESATYATAHDTIYTGEVRIYRPTVATLSVNNLDTGSTCTFEYWAWGET